MVVVANIAAVVLAMPSPAIACNVPVFRYALERWRSAPYEVLLFHRGDLDEAGKVAVQTVFDRVDAGTSNVLFEAIDLDKKKDPALQELFEAEKDAELPWLVVRYPKESRIGTKVWAGKFTPEVLTTLLDSPLRREVSKRILSGETATWLLLVSGNAERDAAAAKLIEAELKKLPETLELPMLTTDPDDAIAAGGPPLKVAFSMLTVSRDDPAERMLVHMLLGSEPDLLERDEPMVFPVFGRGRALFTLVGAGITAENIFDAASFLVGPCSCQVKDLNPGFDLLLATDWNIVPTEATDLGDAVAFNADSGPTVPIPPGTPTPPPAPVTPVAGPTTTTVTAAVAFRDWTRPFLIAIGIGIVLVVMVISGLLALRSSHPARQSHES